MGHTDGEDQERHQDRHRVQRQLQQRQQPHQPDHRDHRTDQRPASQHQRTAIPVQQQRADDEGDDEEHQHVGRAFGDVADGFGETDDVDADAVALVVLANFFQLVRHVLQVQALAGDRVGLLQVGHDHGRRQIIGDDAPDPVGLQRTLAHLGDLRRGAGVAGVHQVAAGETVLDHFGVTHVGGEQ
ncbi:hypothetical protein D3C76_1150890 [compost metagenome]